MSGITKTLLKSILRWTRYPHVKNSPFRIDLSKVSENQKSLHLVKKHLPSHLLAINDAAGVRAAALYCYRTGSAMNSDTENEAQDAMFAAMNYLNSRSVELKMACNSREYRSSDKVLQYTKIRVGQVVQHKELGYRAVCIGWVASAEGKQSLNLLVDWFDVEEMLDGEFRGGGMFEAADFEVLPDGPQTRISHQLIPKYFHRYDSTIGAFIPNKALQYQYPFDMSHVLESTGMFTRDIPSEYSGDFPVNTVSTDPNHDSTLLNERSLHQSQSEAFSVAHLNELEMILKKYHIWSGNEVYKTHQAKILHACEGVHGTLQQLYTDIQDLIHRREIPLDKFGEAGNCHASVLAEVKDLIDELESKVMSSSIPHSPPSDVMPLPGYDDPKAQSLLIELYGPSICNAHYVPGLVAMNDLYMHMFQSDDNPLYPMSAEQHKMHELSHALHVVRSLFLSVEKLLVLRYQNLNGRISEFETYVPGATADPEHMLPSLLKPEVKFRLGEVLRHKKFGYRGVCAGWDVRPITDTSNWEGVVGLRYGQEQPFYRIIPDEDDVKDFLGSRQQRDFYYVAQDNLEIVETVGAADDINNKPDSDDKEASFTSIQADRLLNEIKNRESKTVRNKSMDRFFNEFNSKTGMYNAKESLVFCFSNLPKSPPFQQYEGNVIQKKAFQDCEDFLLDFFAIFKNFFFLFTPSKEDHLLVLLKHALSRADAHNVESFLWILSLSTKNTACSMLMREGLALVSRGSLDQAMKLYIHASREDPNFAGVYDQLANIHGLRDDHVESLAFSTLALQRQPRHFGALGSQGLSLAALSSAGNENNIEGALAALESSLNLNPWVSLVASRYTRMKHDDATMKSNDSSKKVKGSLSVVHLVSDDSDEENDEEAAGDQEKAEDVREGGDSDSRK